MEKKGNAGVPKAPYTFYKRSRENTHALTKALSKVKLSFPIEATKPFEERSLVE